MRFFCCCCRQVAQHSIGSIARCGGDQFHGTTDRVRSWIQWTHPTGCFLVGFNGFWHSGNGKRWILPSNFFTIKSKMHFPSKSVQFFVSNRIAPPLELHICLKYIENYENKNKTTADHGWLLITWIYSDIHSAEQNHFGGFQKSARPHTQLNIYTIYMFDRVWNWATFAIAIYCLFCLVNHLISYVVDVYGAFQLGVVAKIAGAPQRFRRIFVCVCVCFVWVCKLSSVIDYDWMLCMNRKNVSRLAVQCSVRLANQSDRLVRLGQPGWCIANVQSVNFDLYIYRGSSARERASAIINHKSFMIQLNSNEMENRLYFKQKNKEKNV